MKLLLKLLILPIFLGFSYSLSAQMNPLSNKSGIGPKVGYYSAPDAENGAVFIGLQSRSRGEIFGFELAAEYRGQQRYNVTGGTLKVSQIPVTASLLAYVPLTPVVQPYVLAGLGAYYTIYDYDGGFISPGDDSELNLGYHLGLGGEIAVSPIAALNIDYRYLYLDGNNDNFGDKKFSGNVISMGFTFYF